MTLFSAPTGNLVSQHEKLDIFGGGRAAHQQDQPEQLPEDQRVWSPSLKHLIRCRGRVLEPDRYTGPVGRSRRPRDQLLLKCVINGDSTIQSSLSESR